MVQAITVTAPAKVNLHLGIYPGRDERGYHRADSVMIALELADEVTVSPAKGLEVTCEPPLDVPAEKTTIAKAAQRLADAFGVPCNAHIHLVRRIPDKSGMGSASTDSAATLRALCQLWGLDEGDPRVLEIARGLGADVAFFLQPVPSLLVGVGDVLREAFPPLVGMPLVLVRPEGGVGERLELPLRLWRAELQIDVYPAGIILSAEGAECRETTLTLSPVKSSGEVIWQRDDGMADQGETVIRDGSLYTLVLRLHYCDPDDPDDPGLDRLALYGGEHFALNGYMDGGDGVFVAALTEGEVYALRQKIAFSAYEAPVWRKDHGEPADPAQSEPDYAPVSKATLPDGTVMELTSDAYPVGTPFIAWVLTRPANQPGLPRFSSPSTRPHRLESPSGYHMPSRSHWTDSRFQ